MGTANFALPTLSSLIASQHDIIAVYTAAAKPSGRGNQISISAIQKLADKHNIKVFAPHNFKNDVDYDQFKALNADIAIVAAYGIILPERILNSPKHGCINIHPSSLPKFRGAAPIQHTILSGDAETSVCIIQMDKGMDTGDILIKQDLSLDHKITAHELFDITSNIGADLTLKILDQIAANKLSSIKQNDIGASHACKIHRSDEKLNFVKDAYLVQCQVRAFAPKPGAYFVFKGENIKVLEADFDSNVIHHAATGTVLDDKLTIACSKGIFKPKLLQREGRKSIYLDAFLRGFNIAKNSIL